MIIVLLSYMEVYTLFPWNEPYIEISIRTQKCSDDLPAVFEAFYANCFPLGIVV